MRMASVDNGVIMKKSVIAAIGIVCVLGGVIAFGGSDNQASREENIVQEEATTNQDEQDDTVVIEMDYDIPMEYKSAIAQADTYANMLYMSKQGVYDQLVSEYGGQFSAEAAQYAVDNIQVDWNTNALEKAKQYQDSLHMSPEAIRDQLTSEYGEKFTQEEADYAISNLPK